LAQALPEVEGNVDEKKQAIYQKRLLFQWVGQIFKG